MVLSVARRSLMQLDARKASDEASDSYGELRLRYFLENNDTASLTRLQVAGVKGDPPQMWVRGDYEALMARIGYRLEQAGTGIMIARQ